jgi:protein involved in plasmid replication-relaxation
MATQSNKDDQIILFAADYQLVTHQHLVELTGRHAKSLWRSLPRLVARRLLFCRAQGMHKPNVYSTFDIRRRENFKHDLMITDIHVALNKTGMLLEWRQPRQRVKGGVNEDARFEMEVQMQDRRGKITFYLEADAGTEPSWMIEDKFKRYLRAREDERFNVLFVFPDERRAKAFARRAEKFLDRTTPSTLKFLLFTTLDEMKADTLGPICNIAHSAAKFPIIPNLPH